MHNTRFLRFLITLALVVTLLCSFSITAVTADDTTPTPSPTPSALLPPPELKLTCDVPSYTENSATSFYFTVNLSYSGLDTVTVNLSTTPQQGWNSYVTFTSKEVTSVPIGPMTYATPDVKSLSVNFAPNSGTTPEPGTYKLNLKATSGIYSASIDLSGTIKAKYAFSMNTSNSNLAMKATAGKANNLAIEMVNTGSVALENIALNSQKPDGWVITYSPEKIDTIAAGQTVQANVVITPPKDKTVAGDYNITLSSTNPHVMQSLVIRVTVETPTIWGTVALIIIVLVIVGLAVLFLKLGRR
jgi:uncharacterized membrane protein